MSGSVWPFWNGLGVVAAPPTAAVEPRGWVVTSPVARPAPMGSDRGTLPGSSSTSPGRRM